MAEIDVTVTRSPLKSAGRARVAWMPESAATIAIGTPLGGGPPEVNRRFRPARFKPSM